MKAEAVLFDRAPEQADSISGATRSEFSELLERARALAPIVRERAEQTERDRRVSADVTTLLKQAGLYRAVQPRRFGGYELELENLRQLAFEVGQGCTSTGWCYGLSAANAWTMGMFPLQAQEDVWGADADCLLAACIAPTGKARCVEGGFRVRGRWGFASNCDNADWLALGTLVDEGEGRPPRPMYLLLPRADCRIIDNWHTVGLAGTGSKDIVIDEEVFVPSHRSAGFAELLGQEAPGALVNSGGLYRIPFLSGFPPLLANPAVAALRGAVDEFIEHVAMRATRGAFAGGGSTIAQFGHVQTAVAEAEAAIDAAQLILQRDLRLASELSAADVKISTEQRIEFRRGHAYAVRLCVQAVNGLYDVVGGTGIHLDNGIQRAWRDINAVAHHISVNWNAVSTMVGQQRLGLPPRGQY
ncbi:acyl-CoA dehydrogenase family protein [Pusillimonas noertemannii]|uniref:Alkylation response protein AidB-like acyl-CoA dehydrogenase n=1 Tax=Pusillimonas noertemannii TaxID=305977 RepID=A0A2U1CKW4_9BURK|nr:acyl-CoA dehydrogenase family protein [Pusillimonas noertemannii]NYT69157.1 acyl-CoA dehydrogenase [Pusillimonas noertemannii]PVY61624.1 alkylation response protein AidB-like acyl-CoA dehydrogenase [Pusillimonas noertemannii]TFL09570.1 acyl-CoA dehydrogenase [Pusillimonas noertemannii]